MPVKRRLDKSRRLDDYRRQQLLEGPDACLLAGVGYLGKVRAATFALLTDAQRDEVLTDMRRDWELHGGDLLLWWRTGGDAGGVKPWAFVPPGGASGLPWAAREFGEP